MSFCVRRCILPGKSISYLRYLSGNPRDDFKQVAVVGMGLMGHGIVQITAQAGYNVLAIESSDDAMNSGLARIEKSLFKVISKDNTIMEADKSKKVKETMSRISTSTQLSAAKSSDLVIEAIAENIDLKIKFYSELGLLVKPTAIFASNTSSLPITKMAEASQRADKFIGLHFFNPVQMMNLVEVVRTVHTSDETYSSLMKFAVDIGKKPVTCPDTPGFIVNRLLVPFLAQAMLLVDTKVATVADIDVSLQLGAGHHMGPLHLADYIGLDTCLNILTGWTREFPDQTAFFVPHCLHELVSAGRLGRKTGRGFYHWEGDKRGDSAL